jgi:putative transposase
MIWSRNTGGEINIGRQQRIFLLPIRPMTFDDVDFEGKFKVSIKDLCYSLTISEHASCFLINCESLRSTQEATAFRVFEKSFKKYGLPSAIRSDNGITFASGNAAWG